MSKQSTNKKSNTLRKTPDIQTSNRFEVLSQLDSTKNKSQKATKDLEPKAGFDHPNWRHPVNKAQKLYTRTPKEGSHQQQRPKVHLNRSVTDLVLHHCPGDTPINSHWKLPNNTYEKQAYLHWSRENRVAFQRKLPQIPYDPWQYIQRIKAEAHKRKRQDLAKALGNFSKTRKVCGFITTPNKIYLIG